MAANILLAKCSAPNETYGIRVEQRENEWVSTWAFPIDENKAKREGFHKTKITGAFRPVDNYPGCPYCGGTNLLQCCCGKMLCYNEAGTNPNCEIKSEKKQESRKDADGIKCPWCSVTISEIKTVESFTVKSGGY